MARKRASCEERRGQRRPKKARTQEAVPDVFEDQKPKKTRVPRAPSGRRKKRSSDPGGTRGRASKKAGVKTEKKSEKHPGVKEEASSEGEDFINFASVPKKKIQPKTEASVKKDSSRENEEDESEDDWEEVEELNEPVPDEMGGTAASFQSTLPTKPVEIEIETPEQVKARERREKKADRTGDIPSENDETLR